MTVEKTGLAYFKHFPGTEAIQDFTKILDIVDYLDSEFNELREMNKRATINDYDRKRRFS